MKNHKIFTIIATIQRPVILAIYIALMSLNFAITRTATIIEEFISRPPPQNKAKTNLIISIPIQYIIKGNR